MHIEDFIHVIIIIWYTRGSRSASTCKFQQKRLQEKQDWKRETSRFGERPTAHSSITSGASGSKTSNTCERRSDICNVRSLLDDEQDGESVIVRDEEPFSDEGLTVNGRIQSVLQKMVKRRQKYMKSDSSKNRNDVAGQSIDIEWHVCTGVACRYCTSYKSSCRRPGTNLTVFQTGSSS